MTFENVHEEDQKIDLTKFNGMVDVRCDDEESDAKCDITAAIKLPEHADLDALYWNRDEADAMRKVGWVVTPDHDFCPEHAMKAAKPTDARVSFPEPAAAVSA